MIKGYREKIEGELAKICQDTLDILDKHLQSANPHFLHNIPHYNT